MSHVCDTYVDLLRVHCIQGGVEIFLVNSLNKNQLIKVQWEINAVEPCLTASPVNTATSWLQLFYSDPNKSSLQSVIFINEPP